MGAEQVLPSEAVIRAEVRLAIEEDLGGADVTAALVPADARLAANVICREDAVLAGSAWFESVFGELDRSITVEWLKQDGDALGPDDEVCLVQGPARPVLTGERTALNFLQTLSGTATRTAAYVKAIDGTGCKVLDTRKTIPGLRQAQKYAVRCGGGWNHR
ncbi:MAG: nicotinate-nucleotide diphosphorylase, partial [Xanthomonadales bacterium]|nr:nicotinate-nucleotide diphosphorylase [Xanthomonadales bacterium]